MKQKGTLRMSTNIILTLYFSRRSASVFSVPSPYGSCTCCGYMFIINQKNMHFNSSETEKIYEWFDTGQMQ